MFHAIVVWITVLFCKLGRAEFSVDILKPRVVILVTRFVAHVPDAEAWFSRLPGDSSSRDVGCRISALSGFLPHLKLGLSRRMASISEMDAGRQGVCAERPLRPHGYRDFRRLTVFSFFVALVRWVRLWPRGRADLSAPAMRAAISVALSPTLTWTWRRWAEWPGPGRPRPPPGTKPPPAWPAPATGSSDSHNTP